MKHRKSEHSESVPACKNVLNGACGYGQSKCWFTHNDSEIENQNLNVKDQEITEKMLDMMEKITHVFNFLKTRLIKHNNEQTFNI